MRCGSTVAEPLAEGDIGPACSIGGRSAGAGVDVRSTVRDLVGVAGGDGAGESLSAQRRTVRVIDDVAAAACSGIRS